MSHSHAMDSESAEFYTPSFAPDGVLPGMQKFGAKYYTVYLAKDDSIVAFGTARNCARMLGLTPSRFHQLLSQIRSGKSKKYEFYSEPIDEEEGGDPQ